MAKFYLDFEKPLKEIEEKIDQLNSTFIKTGVDVSDAIKDLESKLRNKREEIFSNLSRWERLQIARHPERPHSNDYISRICDYWFEIHGDRHFGDDSAIICGLARINNTKLLIAAQEKGRTTREKVNRNFGMMRPEGYRKAARLFKVAEKYKLPIVSLIDTPGAFPGLGAEERGQAEAIANNLLVMSNIRVPTISIVIGEGASGGALGIGLSDRILCMENTWYSVISPEGCASILFRDSSKAKEAANSMKVTSYDLLKMGIADQIIKEPKGGAHSDVDGSAQIVKDVIINATEELKKIPIEVLLEDRYNKYKNIGDWNTIG